MRWILGLLVVLVFGLGSIGCDNHSNGDDHKGHDHKEGDKH